MKSHLLLMACLPLLSVAGPQGSPMAPGRGAGPQNGSGPSALCTRTGGPAATATACPGRGPNGMMARGVCGGVSLAVPSGTVTTLPATEVVAAIEHERVANDLYALATRWSLRVFDRTLLAEDRHEGALTQLAGTADIAVPAAQPGVYVTPDLQTLYTSVSPLMTESLVGALRGGAFAEETLLVELRRLLGGTLDEGTRIVLTNLEHASQHHLVAFVRNLSVRGETYVPQLLSPEDYQAIVDLEV